MSQSHSLPADIRIGAVHLTVRDLSKSVAFYEGVLGLEVHQRNADQATLGAGDHELLALYEDPAAVPLMRGRTGLYHFAVLVPNRVELAHVLRSIAENEAPWQGASDHLVSEALYLADLDGNGIEVYRDRPRDQWPYQKDGTLAMATDPLDLRDVLSELQHVEDPDSWQSLAPETVIGHMHLHVRDIAEAEQFYGEILGLDLMVRYGDHASFMSAGGYHHHLGFNTWAGQGAPPPPENSVGLRWFDLHLPDEDTLKAVVQRFEAASVPLEAHEGGWIVRDPSRNGLRLLTNGK